MAKIKLEYGKTDNNPNPWYAQNIAHGIVFRAKTLKELRLYKKNVFPWCQWGDRKDITD